MNKFYTQALQIIRSTREQSLPYWGNAEVIAQKSSSAGDVVTKLDQEIERYLEKEFKKLDPEIAFVGEEFDGDRVAS